MKTQHTFNISLLVTRFVLGTVIAAHGAQKLFGWFGGFGFEGTMGFFTGILGLPYLLALLLILAESFGMVALAFGLFTRTMSAALVVIMMGAVVTTHIEHGFFMNWFGVQSGEGYEYHILVIALALVTLLNGAGAYSLDQLIRNKFQSQATHSARPSLG